MKKNNRNGNIMTILLIGIVVVIVLVVVVILVFGGNKKSNYVDLLANSINDQVSNTIVIINNSELLHFLKSMARPQSTINAVASIATDYEDIAKYNNYTYEFELGYDRINKKYGIDASIYDNKDNKLDFLYFHSLDKNYLKFGDYNKNIEYTDVEPLETTINSTNKFNIEIDDLNDLIKDLSSAIISNISDSDLTNSSDNNSTVIEYKVDNIKFMKLEEVIDNILLEDEYIELLSSLLNKDSDELIDSIEEEKDFDGTIDFKVILDSNNNLSSIEVLFNAKVDKERIKYDFSITINDDIYIIRYNDNVSENEFELEVKFDDRRTIDYKITWEVSNDKVIKLDGSMEYEIENNSNEYSGNLTIEGTIEENSDKHEYRINIDLETSGSYDLRIPIISSSNTISSDDVTSDLNFAQALMNNKVFIDLFVNQDKDDDEIFIDEVKSIVGKAEEKYQSDLTSSIKTNNCYLVTSLNPSSNNYKGCLTLSNTGVVESIYIFDGVFQTYGETTGMTRDDLSNNTFVLNSYSFTPTAMFCPASCQ